MSADWIRQSRVFIIIYNEYVERNIIFVQVVTEKTFREKRAPREQKRRFSKSEKIILSIIQSTGVSMILPILNSLRCPKILGIYKDLGKIGSQGSKIQKRYSSNLQVCQFQYDWAIF